MDVDGLEALRTPEDTERPLTQLQRPPDARRRGARATPSGVSGAVGRPYRFPAQSAFAFAIAFAFAFALVFVAAALRTPSGQEYRHDHVPLHSAVLLLPPHAAHAPQNRPWMVKDSGRIRQPGYHRCHQRTTWYTARSMNKNRKTLSRVRRVAAGPDTPRKAAVITCSSG